MRLVLPILGTDRKGPAAARQRIAKSHERWWMTSLKALAALALAPVITRRAEDEDAANRKPVKVVATARSLSAQAAAGDAGKSAINARGHSYVAVMAARDGGTPNHRLWDVADVGHDGDRMVTSACGLAALFDLPGCAVAP
jgi:hypothetical protein